MVGELSASEYELDPSISVAWLGQSITAGRGTPHVQSVHVPGIQLRAVRGPLTQPQQATDGVTEPPLD